MAAGPSQSSTSPSNHRGVADPTTTTWFQVRHRPCGRACPAAGQGKPPRLATIRIASRKVGGVSGGWGFLVLKATKAFHSASKQLIPPSRFFFLQATDIDRSLKSFKPRKVVEL
jgi:hypothetical protein